MNTRMLTSAQHKQIKLHKPKILYNQITNAATQTFTQTCSIETCNSCLWLIVFKDIFGSVTLAYYFSTKLTQKKNIRNSYITDKQKFSLLFGLFFLLFESHKEGSCKIQHTVWHKSS